MSYIVNTPTLKKKFCTHEFKKYRTETEPIYICTRCGKRKKVRPKQTNLLEFIHSAFKPTVPNYVEEHKFLSNWEKIEHDGWKLPATAEPHSRCGMWQTRGCLHVEDHFTPESEGKAWVKNYQWSCFRPSCKECYPKWIGRQANRSTRRIEEYQKLSGKFPRHLILCPPKWKHEQSEKKLRDEAYTILKNIHCFGGSIVFHPFRCDKDRQYYYFPHYHVLGFGKIRGITKNHYRHGWFIKSMGYRKSIFHTFHYLLSHCGIKKSHHAVTWFGDLSYSKLRLENEPDFSVCPSCGRKVVPIYYEGIHPVVPPDGVFEGFVDSEGWHLVETMNEEVDQPYQFEYAPFRELNEIILSITMAN